MSDNSLYKKIRITTITEPVEDFKTFVFANDHHIQYKAGQLPVPTFTLHGRIIVVLEQRWPPIKPY